LRDAGTNRRDDLFIGNSFLGRRWVQPTDGHEPSDMDSV
jgi:hypothetical protein